MPIPNNHFFLQTNHTNKQQVSNQEVSNNLSQANNKNIEQ